MERLGNLQSLIFSKMSYGGDTSVARKTDSQDTVLQEAWWKVWWHPAFCVAGINTQGSCLRHGRGSRCPFSDVDTTLTHSHGVSKNTGVSHWKKVHPHSDLAFVLFRLSTLSLPYPPVLLSLYVGLFLSL